MSNPNHKIIQWAREAAGLSLEDAALKLGLKDTKVLTAIQKLEKYENGSASPSRSTLSKMASQYKRPLLTFYLPNIPVRADKGEDFRSLAEGLSIQENSQIEALVRNIKVRQGLIKSALIEEDEAKDLPFIGASTMQDGVDRVAGQIKVLLDFQLDAFRRSADVSIAFSHLRALVERQNVFVLLKGNLGSHHTNIDARSFRGFALADKVAPFIVINDHDSKAAWSFTLLHELAHLLLGQTGISAGYSEIAIEKFCNDVASEVLLPAVELGSGTEFKGLSFEDLMAVIGDRANRFKISRTLIAYRLLRINVINADTFARILALHRQQWVAAKAREKEKNREKDGGPSSFIINRHKLGASLVSLVDRLNTSGTLSVSKAAMVLGVKPISVFSFLNSGRAA